MMNRESTRSIRSRRKSTRSTASAGGSWRIHAVRLARGFFGWGSSGCFSSFAGEGFGSGPRRVQLSFPAESHAVRLHRCRTPGFTSALSR